MKALVAIALALVIPTTASAERRTYDIKATRKGGNRYSSAGSCGALDRMMKDKHVLAIDEENDLVGVNGLRWKVVSNEPDLVITFHDKDGQLTYLTMDLYVNRRGLTGKYVLSGIVRDKDDPRAYSYCQDTVYVDGTRR